MPRGLQRLVRALLAPLALLSERLGNRFYPVLAAVVVAAFLYGIAAGTTGDMEHRAYDFIMKSRFRVPPADPALVLVDIDEASLAAMAPEYGRWPWPRAVLAELAEDSRARNRRRSYSTSPSAISTWGGASPTATSGMSRRASIVRFSP